MAVLNLLISSILLPLVATALLWRQTRSSASSWFATFFMAAGLCGFSWFIAPWGVFGVGVHWAIAALFVLATLISLAGRARKTGEGGPQAEVPTRMLVKILIGFFFGGVALGALRGREIPGRALDVRFPLDQGRYLVLHGGSTAAVNTHVQDPQQRYAVDLVKLNGLGMRAGGIAPSDPRQYAIFGATVLAPCSGTVVRTADGKTDGAVSTDPLGNVVVIRCGATDVTLAHLQRASIVVRSGVAIAAGTPIARVGSSGLSPEPHLHIHAVSGDAAVPLTFEGAWLVRNARVTR